MQRIPGLIIVILLVILSFKLLNAQSVIVLKDYNNEFEIGNNLEYYLDYGKKLDITQMSSPDYSDRFIKSKEYPPNFGLTEATIWIRFKICDSTATSVDWRLQVNYQRLDSVFLFFPSGPSYIKKTNGAHIRISEREIRKRNITFHLPTIAKTPQYIYLRITSGGNLTIPLKIIRAESEEYNDHNSQLLLGMFYGAVIILLIYNMFLFLSIKDKVYLYYVVYVACYTQYQLMYDMILHEYIYIPFPGWERLDAFCVLSASMIFGTLFTQSFLDAKRIMPRTDKVLAYFRYLAGFVIVIVLMTFSLIPNWGTVFNRIVSSLVLIYSVLVSVAAVISLRKNYRPGVFFTTAILGYLIGFSTRILTILGILPLVAFTKYGFQVGILWEIVVLAFALGNRINTIKYEKEMEKEEMRVRLASDLHDEIGSNLSSISINSDLLKNSSLLGESEISKLKSISITAHKTADSIRDIVWFMNPEHDSEADLDIRMKEITKKMLPDKVVTVELQNVNLLRIPDLYLRRNFFFLYKEILNNISKHASAKNITVIVKKVPPFTVLEVSDDGIGFSANDISSYKGEGLKSIRYRAEQLGGELIIKSKPGEGTQIIVSFKI